MLVACGELAPDPIEVAVDSWCEGTNPMHCMLPWPSDRWLTDDPSTETGYRLNYDPLAIPENIQRDTFDVSAYNIRDGFSPSSTLLTVFPSAVDTEATPGLAVEGEWGLSLAAESPTILINLDTGEWVPHMVEIDARAQEDIPEGLAPAPTLLYLRPAWRLDEDTDYGVALRNLRLVDGTDAETFPPFRALRDGTPTTSAIIEDRRASYEELFETLERAGVDRTELVQAWRFHTASAQTTRGDLLAMRDDAMQRVPVGGGECTVETVREDYSDQVFRRLDGTFKIPLYMDRDVSGARVVRGPDGLPEFQGWADAPFTLMVPHSALTARGPGHLLSFGHGLMGAAADEGGSNFVRRFANRFNFVSVATDWQGMSERDIVVVGTALSNVSSFPAVGDRLMQGVINQLVMVRSFLGACRDLPQLQAKGVQVIAEGEPYYLGISQGGIMGGTVMGLSQDTLKGALLVGAMNYPLMIGRSVDFEEYEVIYKTWYPERIDREILMSLMITLWDGAEPNAWMPHLVRDPAPNTPAKQILYQVARHDSQVPNLASDIAVRTMEIPQLAPAREPIWGVSDAAGPVDSAYVYYDFNAEAPPEGNQAPSEDNDTHGDQRYTEGAQLQMGAFFQPEGQVMHFCEGPCDPD
ncbi:MAG TPA: hypothetical protein DIU15_04280 [Deltaproteobacteria bacterium]|nr:hypothetical protein [Deltaproteobacteria bacterium]HCP45231.1 hypothetical protein [Deltaproteobacteria bacterium]